MTGIPTSDQWEAAFQWGQDCMRGSPREASDIVHGVLQQAMIKLRAIHGMLAGKPEAERVEAFLQAETEYMGSHHIRIDERKLLSAAFRAIREDLTEVRVALPSNETAYAALASESEYRGGRRW